MTLKDHRESQHSSLNSNRLENYLGEFVYGGMDGCVTTFAVVSGAVGANLDSSVIIILGFANLFADGLSMSIGAFLSARSDLDKYEKHKKIEYWEVDNMPEAEREEVRQIYREKGFTGDTLETIVDTITSERERWVEDMMRNELHMIPDHRKPFWIGFFTFASFIVIGLIPLSSYLIDYIQPLSVRPFLLASILTGLGFTVIGFLKSRVTEVSTIRGVLETLLLGAAAAMVSYYIGDFIEHLISG